MAQYTIFNHILSYITCLALFLLSYMPLTWKENTRTTSIMYTPTLPQPQFKEKPVCRSSLWCRKASSVLKICSVVVPCPTYHHKDPLKISNTERESIRIKQCLFQRILKGKKTTHRHTRSVPTALSGSPHCSTWQCCVSLPCTFGYLP